MYIGSFSEDDRSGFIPTWQGSFGVHVELSTCFPIQMIKYGKSIITVNYDL